jgi:hypothetical protein
MNFYQKQLLLNTTKFYPRPDGNKEVYSIIILKFRLNLKKNAPPIALKSGKDGN